MNTAAKLINKASKDIEPVSNVPYLEAELLFCFIKKITTSELYINPDVNLSEKEQQDFGTIINKRAKGIPHAYLTGIKEFYGREFEVSEDVLIPRPETELIIDETIRVLENLKNPEIVDIGTGSGCIAITLALEIMNLDIIASDIDASALNIAKKNSKKFGISDHISFIESDLLAGIKQHAEVIVANLPYVTESDKQKLAQKHTISLKYEPQHALYAGDDGLMLYNRLIEEIKYDPPKYLLLEIDPGQSKKLSKTIAKILSPKEIKIKKDLAGHDRLIIVSF